MNTVEIISKINEQMRNISTNTKEEIKKIRTNKIDTETFKNIFVMIYGVSTPLLQIANIKNIDSRTVEIKPWEKNFLPEIEKEIIKSNLGLNPQNNGEVIILTAPVLTEERRLQLIKIVKELVEKDKIKIRNIRQKSKEDIKKLKEEKFPEDMIKKTEEQLQKTTDTYIKELDVLFENKKKDLLQV